MSENIKNRGFLRSADNRRSDGVGGTKGYNKRMAAREDAQIFEVEINKQELLGCMGYPQLYSCLEYIVGYNREYEGVNNRKAKGASNYNS